MRIGFFALAAVMGLSAAQAAGYDPTEKSIAQLEADMAAGRVTAQGLVRAYLDRIRRLDYSGPHLQSVIALNPATVDADAKRSDYSAALKTASLKGVRLGVFHVAGGGANASTNEAFAVATAQLKAAGAEVVELAPIKVPEAIWADELAVLLTELKAGMNSYLATTTAKTRTLADVIAFNRTTPRETALFGQDLFEKAEATKGDASKERTESRDFARSTLDKLLTDGKLDALITPSGSPSWRIDVLRGDRDAGESASLPAIAGYPHLTVPMGFVKGMPVGISFIGTAWSEAKLLAIGAAYEEVSHMRRAPTFAPSLETAADTGRAFAPEPQAMPK